LEQGLNAKMHGARGVVLMNDRAAHPGEADELEKFAEAAGTRRRRHSVCADPV
jgi:hypothetical protein